MRSLISDFSFANPFYAGFAVTAWRCDPVTLGKTVNKATLYADLSSAAVRTNPQTLDAEGKFVAPVYFDEPIILEITGADVPDHETGVIMPAYRNMGTWATAQKYWPGDIVTDGAAGANTKNLYTCNTAHTSGVWATDLAAAKWSVLLDTSALQTAIVAAVISAGVGISEAPNNGTPYARQSAGWVATMTATAINAALAALQAQITSASGNLLYIGTYNATAHTADYTAASGLSDGVLVAASAASGKYVIVTTAGTGIAPAPVVAMSVGDQLISDGTSWNRLPLATTLADTQITTSGLSGIAATNVNGALAEIISDLAAEITNRGTAVSSEASTRASADTTETNARIAADNALSASITAAIATANSYTDTKVAAFDAVADGGVYGRKNNAWVPVVQDARRQTASTSDTPAATDVGGVIGYTAATAVAVTINDLGAMKSVTVQQQGAGQVTVTPGAGVTLISAATGVSAVNVRTARRGASIVLTGSGTGSVYAGGLIA